MKWNYRVVKHLDTTYHIHEVYYNKSGKPTGMSDSMFPMGESVDELWGELSKMLSATLLPVFVPPKKWSKK